MDEVAPPEMPWQLLQTGGDLLVGSRLGGFLRATISYRYADVVVGENDGSTMLHWGVEVVPSLVHTADRIDSLMQLQKHTKVQWKGEGSKIIRYVKADLDGVINEMAWSNIRLNSNSLVITMQMILQQDNDVLHAAICVRGGQYGQLTPLLVDLPTSNDRVDVVLLSPNTAVHLHLLYPEWRAESMAWPVPLPRLAVASSAEGPEGLSILDKMDKYLPDEVLYSIVLRLPTMSDIMHLAFTCKWFYRKLAAIGFARAYCHERQNSVRTLVAAVNCETVEIAATAPMEHVVVALDAILDRGRFRVLDTRFGQVLLYDETIGDMIIANPMNGDQIHLPTIEPPVLHTFLAAGLVQTKTGDRLVMALFARRTSSVLGTDCAWICSSHLCPGPARWMGHSQPVRFRLPQSRLQIRSPSILAEEHWHLLSFNDCILSISLDGEHALSRLALPFETRVDKVPAHLLAKIRDGSLALLVREDGVLTVWVYRFVKTPKNWECEQYKSYFVEDLALSSVAEENSLILNPHLIALNIETGDFSLPFQLPDEYDEGQVVNLKMPWPPRPILVATGP